MVISFSTTCFSIPEAITCPCHILLTGHSIHVLCVALHLTAHKKCSKHLWERQGSSTHPASFPPHTSGAVSSGFYQQKRRLCPQCKLETLSTRQGKTARQTAYEHLLGWPAKEESRNNCICGARESHDIRSRWSLIKGML